MGTILILWISVLVVPLTSFAKEVNTNKTGTSTANSTDCSISIRIIHSTTNPNIKISQDEVGEIRLTTAGGYSLGNVDLKTNITQTTDKGLLSKEESLRVAQAYEALKDLPDDHPWSPQSIWKAPKTFTYMEMTLTSSEWKKTTMFVIKTRDEYMNIIHTQDLPQEVEDLKSLAKEIKERINPSE
jgi:hypothetical protein